MNYFKNLKAIKGDASFRKFFRKRNGKFTSVIVFAKKEKFKNLLVYDSINKILNNNKILAPVLYQENYDENYIEVQDFGNDTIFNILKNKIKHSLDLGIIKNIEVLPKKVFISLLEHLLLPIET